MSAIPQISVGQIDQALKRIEWRKDPVKWAEDRLNEKLWSGQKRIMQSVAKHRKTAIATCHEIGKSFIAARIAAWWIDTHKPGTAFVLTTAPTNKQVKAILWKEINRVHSKGVDENGVITGLAGRTNQNEWYLTTASGKEELVAMGRKPSDYDAAAFQGIHAEAVLVIVDESCGVRGEAIWEAIDSLIANDNSVILLIGNPDDNEAEFAKFCEPGSGFNVISIGAFDTPAFTGEQIPPKVLRCLIGRTYVEEKRKKWAPDWRWSEDGKRVLPPEGKTLEQALEEANPFWVSKVLGIFPSRSNKGGLIPLTWIRAAMDREEVPTVDVVEFGVDVGAGGDSSTIGCRWGKVFRVLHEDHNPDTMQTCGKIVELRKKWRPRLVKVDKIGIGLGIVNRGQELKEPFVGVNVGEAAQDTEHYVNRRAELWWGLRERFEAGDIDIDARDEDLAAELASVRYKRNSRGQIVIESKEEAKRRGVPSPNRADCMMLCFGSLPVQEKKVSAGLLFKR